MGKHDWTMGISLKGLDAEFRWRERSYGGEYLGYEASVVNPSGEEISYLSPWRRESILSAASALRRAEIQDEWDFSALADPEVFESIVLELFERSQDGEYLGNGSGTELLFVQDLAGIFELDEEHILATLRKLAVAKKLSLEGMVLRPYDPEHELPSQNQWSKRGMRR